MNKILLVDIDTGMLNIFKGIFKEHADKVEIMTSGSIREVPNIISSTRINMVIIDLKMPDIDDFEFLEFMNKNYAHIPVVVTTAFGTPDIESRIKQLESCEYFEKPVDMDSLKEKIFDDMNIGVGGQIHGIGLSSFLQMSEMEKTTCTLKIKANDNLGYLYLLKGELIAAETGLLTGQDAACEIVGWENAVIEIEKGTVRKKKEINMPLMNILMEALRIKDEKENLEQAKTQKEKPSKTQQLAATGNGLELEMEEPAEEAAPEDAEQVQAPVPETKGPPPGIKTDAKLLSASKTIRRRKIITTTCTLLVLAALSTGGWLAWVHLVKPALIKKKYDDVIVSIGRQEFLDEKYKLLKSYIDGNKGSPFLASAREKLSEINHLIQEQDFKRAITGVEALSVDDDFNMKARALYNGYLEKHPDGPHVAEIKEKLKKIESIIDEKRYEKLQRVPQNDYRQRIMAYNEYLSKHPEGKYRADVLAMRKKQAEEYYTYVKKQVTKCERKNDLTPCIRLCREFIADYRDSPQVPKMRILVRNMQIRQIMGSLKKKVEVERLEPKAAKELYAEYLEKNPNTPAAENIRVIVEKLDNKVKNRSAWEAIYAYSKNPDIGIDDRIDSLKKYIAQEISDQYRAPAQKMVDVLEAEKKNRVQKAILAKKQKKKEQEELAKLIEEKKRIDVERKKMASEIKLSGSGRYTVNDDGTVSDMQTGLLWNILDTHIELKRCLTYKQAKAYVGGMDIGGYDDWRLPTTYDLLMILNTQPGFPETGAKWYWTSESYVKGFHEIANSVERKTDGVWKKGDAKLTECGAVRAVRP